jgi:hypothetical protein
MQNGHVWGGKMKPPPGIKVYKKGEKAMITDVTEIAII